MDELKASLIAITAAGCALEAITKRMGRPMDQRTAQWPYSKRAGAISTVLDRLIKLDEEHRAEWPQRPQDLFVTRNEAVHPDAGTQEPVPGMAAPPSLLRTDSSRPRPPATPFAR